MSRRNRSAEHQGQGDDAADASLVGPLSRRNFLAVAGVGGAAAAAVAATGGIPHAGAAVASSVRSQATTTTVASGGGASGDNKDVAIAQFAASVELVATGAYQATLDAAGAGKLGAIPPAGAEFVSTALNQHTIQLQRWNEILQDVGQTAVTTPDPKLQATVDTAFAQVTDFVGAAKLARTLEETASATYLSALPTITNKSFRLLAGSNQIIDAQHVAILNYVLGEYPVPDTFAKTDKAATP